jgi:hypothetical protein
MKYADEEDPCGCCEQLGVKTQGKILEETRRKIKKSSIILQTT